MNYEQREKLRGYAMRKDREPEPVFVGRDDIFEVVTENVRGAKSRFDFDPEGPGKSTGKTVCLTGPPGVGKSAFVNALKRRKDFDGCKAHVVEMPRSDLHHPGCVLATVANAVKGFKFDEKFKDRLTSFGIGLTAAGTGGRMSLSWNPKTPPPFTSFPVELFAEGAKTLLKKGHAFVLVTDEAQGIDPSPGSRSNGLLAHLHHGVPLPIVPVLVGQSNTQARLSETISGSRYADGNEPRMIGLKNDEARDYVLGMLDWLAVEGTPAQRQALAEWIVGECGGWPHHLSNAMKAVAEGLLAADSMRLEDLEGEAVGRSLTARRVRYYESRYKSREALGVCREALLALLDEAAQAPIPDVAMLGKVAGAFKQRPPFEGFGVSAKEFYDAVVSSGVLARQAQAGSDGKPTGATEWICPIASMAQYIKDGTHRPEAPFPDIRFSAGGH